MKPLLLAAIGLSATVNALADERLFQEKVADIFERRCVSCHGESSPKGKLSLTSSRAFGRGGEGGPAVVPGKPDESPLIEKVSGPKPGMPKNGEPLKPDEIAALRTWVERGAGFPETLVLRDRKFDGSTWWSLAPLKSSPTPAVRGAAKPSNFIDAFVIAKLEENGLAPSPEADRLTLIRRLSFDLSGLPPTPNEINAFLNDSAPNAYERLTDRMLDSPRYGERWARHWLDVVHYGDTHGYDKDKRRDNAWPYRDYVVDAFNRDVSYDRFIKEQLAGDVLAAGDPKGVIATGFIAAGPWDFVGHVELREGTVDKEKTRLIDRDDMLANAMSTFVSLTVHCARCHDHKFDPIPQRDYYRLQAVFAGVDRGDRPYASGEQAARKLESERKRIELSERLKPISQRIAALSSPRLVELDERIKSAREALATTTRPEGATTSRSNGYHSNIHPAPDATAWVRVDLGASVPIDEIRLIPARPTDFPDTPGFGFPTKFEVEISDDPEFARSVVVASESRPEFLNVEDEPYVIRPGGTPARHVRVKATRLWRRTNDYVFALGELEVVSSGKNLARGKPAVASESIEAGRWGKAHLTDGFDSRRPRPGDADANARRRADALYLIREAERDRKREAERLMSPEDRAARDALTAEIAAVDEAIRKIPPGPTTYAVKPVPIRPIRLLSRGDVEQPGEPVGPGSLSCVKGLSHDFKDAVGDEGRRRLALAEWIANPNNPLTWRSIVNRVWHYHFGRGLVDTPNDFGRNGSKPTHPELLDRLALDFLENGKSIKKLHKLIVRSATYRQVSRDVPAFSAIDADNRYLWRANRRRLEAESIRDAVLAVSGELDLRMGGPGFELFRFKDDHSPIYDHAAVDKIVSPEGRRRAIYRFAARSVPNPFLECMDAADPNTNTPVRSTTITALQALALLNDPFMLAQSEAFAKRLEKEAETLEDRVDAACRRAFGRPPRSEIREALASYAGKHGLASLCRLLFNANEFVFVD